MSDHQGSRDLESARSNPSSSDHQELRERIASVVRTTLSRNDAVHITEQDALWVARDVLDALGLERVGWRCSHGRLDVLPSDDEDEPVYRLTRAAESDTEVQPDLDRERDEAELNGSMDRGEGMP